jgi:tropomyosin
MDRIKERLASLRQEADTAVARAEDAEGKVKKLEQEILNKDQEIQSLNHRLTITESKLDEAEGKVNDAKHVRDEHESSRRQTKGCNARSNSWRRSWITLRRT